MEHNKAARLGALYTFCVHYHGGQWSRLYRLLCRTEQAWKRHAGIGVRLDYWEKVIEVQADHPVTVRYRQLEARYANDSR